MKYSLRATSIIESMIVLLIVVTWITGVYSLMTSSQKLANSTELRIEAIQIARDGLEIATNIRDTNWILYAADYENCWNVINYNPDCIWDSGNYGLRIRDKDAWGWNNRKYFTNKNTSNQWELEVRSRVPSWFDFSTTPYSNTFRVWKDTNGLYTQGSAIDKELNTLYTRDLTFEYFWINDERVDDKVIVTSTVQWQDSSKTTPQKIELSTTLTNWKAKK